MSFIPPDAPGAECALYDSSVDSLRLMLGGASRVEGMGSMRRWTARQTAKEVRQTVRLTQNDAHMILYLM